MIATTTLNKLREHQPCTTGWKRLLAHLGKAQPDGGTLPLSVILESNGLYDALWALRAAVCDREARLFSCDCAQAVAHLNPDPRVQASIHTARGFADGNATREELAAAGAAAWAAAWDAAGDAARDAARAAAWAAAWDDQKQLFIKHFCTP